MKFLNFDQFLNENETYGKSQLAYRGVADLIRKKFPTISFEAKNLKKGYYSPSDSKSHILYLNKYSSWVYEPVKLLTFLDKKSAFEVFDYLQLNGIKTWTNMSRTDSDVVFDQGNSIYVIANEVYKKLKNEERSIKYREKKEDEEQKLKIKHAEESAKKLEYYKTKIYPLLQEIPKFKKLIGYVSLSELSNTQASFFTIGSFKVLNGSSSKDIQELEKILKDNSEFFVDLAKKEKIKWNDIEFILTPEQIDKNKTQITKSKYGL